MSKLRRFNGQAVTRLIVSVPLDTLMQIDALIGYPYGGKHPAKGNRSEFVRLALLEKLEREMPMI
ncbi:hypothetical protein [Silvimonas soli]|uniref:hypothetical protein n=1 Tax=Silvimonas soli TaxID=2980100 RepID=UPI0024B3BE19|nr:hypothetical protein [Silvimonas soli]